MQQCSEEDRPLHDVSTNWSTGWLTCNMSCNRQQSLIKLSPVNDVNMFELVFVSVSEINVWSTCFDFPTTFQVTGWCTAVDISYKLVSPSDKNHLLYKLHRLCRENIIRFPNVLALSAFCVSYTALRRRRREKIYECRPKPPCPPHPNTLQYYNFLRFLIHSLRRT